ncbi:MAG TPA: hypothetical protein VM409_01385 [Chloroflexia bacterium]|nr:hypothetical protein [Chloroflexia bacterium]
MRNRTQLRARLREELGDTGSVKVWSDAILDDLLVESVGWYSRLWPRQSTAYRDVAEGQRVFEEPPGTLGVTQVECPPGRVLPQEAGWASGGDGASGVRQSWSEWGGVIYLGNAAKAGEAGTSKLIMRVLLPWDRLDPVEPWNGPEGDERLLVLWSATEAWAWLDGQDQKRGRPAGPGSQTNRYAQQLEREVEARRRAATSRTLEAGMRG